MAKNKDETVESGPDVPRDQAKEQQASSSNSDPTGSNVASRRKKSPGSSGNVDTDKRSAPVDHRGKDKQGGLEASERNVGRSVGAGKTVVVVPQKRTVQAGLPNGEMAQEFLSSLLNKFWRGKEVPWWARRRLPSGTESPAEVPEEEEEEERALPQTLSARGWGRLKRVLKIWKRKGAKTTGQLSRSAEEFSESALNAVVSNGYKYFYEYGPRWRPKDEAKEKALAIFEWKQRQLDFEKKQQMAARQLASLEYNRDYVAPPFQLPATRVPSLALDFARGDYIVTIVTTACLPWLTGTSINPLLRAAYLEQVYKLRVTILFPWIPVEQQQVVYNGTVFATATEQADYVRRWVEHRLNIKTRMRILFYDAWYDPRKGSIFPLDRSDVTEGIPDEEADVAVLEEPEHLCWYHMVGPKWRTKFRWVVGVAHTNYVEYIKRDLVHGGPNTAKVIFVYSWLVTRANCDRVIRLSAAVQPFADSVVCNVHGVSPQFLVEYKGQFTRGVYFIGKVLWGKGYRELCDLFLYHCQHNGFPTKPHTLPAGNGGTEAPCATLTGNAEVGRSEPAGTRRAACTNGQAVADRACSRRGGEVWMDVYGSGFDEEEVMGFATRHGLPMRFHGKRDHADPELREYKVFVNPSLSDVVCTTTAEALAMGKIAVVADHPSNEFFRDNFPENCIVYDYRIPAAFSAALLQAQSRQPARLRPEQRHLLTWEAATERFMTASGLM